MIARKAFGQIVKDLQFFPVAGIFGPRQVGKTTLAKMLEPRLARPALYIDLELESHRRKLDDAETYLQFHTDKCIIIDEIQLMPTLFPLLRALIDKNRQPGRFILLGSASPELIRASSETLAGRIAFRELMPFSLPEISGAGDMRKHWLRGGFPEAFLASEESFIWRWLESFIRTFIERDLRELGHDVSPPLLYRLLRMISHLHGKLLNASDLSRSLAVSQPTVKKYLDLLEGGFLIQRLMPYFPNVGKRLVKSPKLYLRDSGLLHQLSNIKSLEALLGHPLVGASWEGYVVEQVKRVGGSGLEMYFYRTHAGAEVDLFIIGPHGKKACLEINYSNAPSVSKGFYQSLEDLMPDAQYVIIPDGEPYPKSGGIIVCNLSRFLTKELPAFME